VAVDSVGNATVVWEANDANGPSVKMSRIPVGQLPSSPTKLSQNAIFDSPQVAVDAANNATIVWTELSGVTAVVRMVRVSPTGTVSAPTSVSAGGQTVMFPRIGVNARGDTWITWAAGVVPTVVVQAVQIPVSGVASVPINIASFVQFSNASAVAVDAAGNATIVWPQFSPSATSIQAARVPLNGVPSSPITLSSSGLSVQSPVLGGDPNGNATVIWQTETLAGHGIQMTQIPFGGAPTVPVTLCPPTEDASDAQLAVNAAGAATVVWQAHGGVFIGNAFAVQIPSGGLPGPQIPLAPSGLSSPQLPQVGMDTAGNAIFVWKWPNLIQGMRMPPSGIPTTAVNLSASGVASAPQLAVSAAGNATATWLVTQNNGTLLQASIAVAQNDVAMAVPSDRYLWLASLVLLLAGAIELKRSGRSALAR
jgi:hypothetical protein